jgi:hypothetical protein
MHYFHAWVITCGFHKKRVGSRHAELVFLHPVRFTDHVVHSSASGARDIDAQFFMLRWTWSGIHKKRVGTRYAELVFLHPVRSLCHVVHF